MFKVFQTYKFYFGRKTNRILRFIFIIDIYVGINKVLGTKTIKSFKSKKYVSQIIFLTVIN